MKLFHIISTSILGAAMVAGAGAAALHNKNSAKPAEAVSAGDIFTRISAVSDLSDGDEIIFVNQGETRACNTTQNTNNRGTSAITVSSHTYTYAVSDSLQVFTVKKNGDDFGFHTGSGYIYSASNTNNYLKTNTTAASTAPSGTSAWTLSISNYVVSATNKTNTSYYLAFNDAIFAQYKQGQSKPYIFKKTGSASTTITNFSVSPSAALNVEEDESINPSQYTISGSKNGGAVATLSADDYTFQGCGTGSEGTFSSLSTTIFKAGATRLQWKSNYPTTAGGSTYLYAGIQVTVKAEEVEYVKVTDASKLQSGKKYLLVEEVVNGGKYYAMANVVSSIGQAAEVTLDTTNHKITSKVNKGNALEYTLGGSADAWTLYGAGVYLSYSGSSNDIKTSASVSGNSEKWTITPSTGSIANNSATTRKIQFNYNNGNPRFACYSTSQTAVYLYEKVALSASVSLLDSLECYVGQTGQSLTAEASNFEPDTFVWESNNTDVVAVSGNTATGALTLKAAGTARVTLTASKGETSASAHCDITVKAAPTAVQVKVSGSVVDSEFVLEQYENNHKQPTVEVLPTGDNGASQAFTSSVLSETVSGAFTTNGARINYVKPATGVIRFASSVKEDVYFDLKVKCNADPYTEDSLTFSGTPATQSYGMAFDATGLTFTITRASGNKTVNKSELTFAPEKMDFDTTIVTATHAASGQSIEIPVSVTQPISVADALAIIATLGTNEKTDEKYTVLGYVSYAQDLSGTTYKSQDYRISDNGSDTNTLTIFRGTWIDGEDMSYSEGIYVGVGDKVIVNGQLQNYNGNTPEMVGNPPLVKITIYYMQILEWINTNMHLNDYNSNSGYCKDNEHHYYLTAKATLKALNDECPGAIEEFESNQEADFRPAYERYVAWAEANGDATPFDGEATIVNSSRINDAAIKPNDKVLIMIVIIASSITLTTVGAFFLVRRFKKHD